MSISMDKRRSRDKQRKLADVPKEGPSASPFDEFADRLTDETTPGEDIDGVISMLGDIDVDAVESLAKATESFAAERMNRSLRQALTGKRVEEV